MKIWLKLRPFHWIIDKHWEVPPEIKNLVSLQRLYLFSNKLSGEIPAELGELTKLTELRLDYNELSGKIPDGLGNISEIALQNNRLVGQIPLSLYENRTGKMKWMFRKSSDD